MKRNNTLRRGLAVATVVSAFAAPVASAAPVEEFIPSTVNGPTETHKDYSKNSVGGDYAPLSGESSGQQAPARVAQVGGDNGFDWGDAGIGAGGLIALAAIASGVLVAIRHRPDARHTVA